MTSLGSGITGVEGGRRETPTLLLPSQAVMVTSTRGPITARGYCIYVRFLSFVLQLISPLTLALEDSLLHIKKETKPAVRVSQSEAQCMEPGVLGSGPRSHSCGLGEVPSPLPAVAASSPWGGGWTRWPLGFSRSAAPARTPLVKKPREKEENSFFLCL